MKLFLYEATVGSGTHFLGAYNGDVKLTTFPSVAAFLIAVGSDTLNHAGDVVDIYDSARAPFYGLVPYDRYSTVTHVLVARLPGHKYAGRVFRRDWPPAVTGPVEENEHVSRSGRGWSARYVPARSVHSFDPAEFAGPPRPWALIAHLLALETMKAVAGL